MPKTVAGIRFENVMPKEVRGNITQLRLAESAGEWERVKKYSKSLTEHFLDVCDSSKAIDYADKFEKCTLKLTGKPSFESNDLFYKASVLSGHAKTTIQYGERILGQIRDQEELYELYVTLGNAYIRRYENLELQPNLLDSAYAYFLKAAKMLKKEDKSKRGHLLLNMGIYYRHKKENANAITNFERAFNIGKETHDIELKILAIENQALLYNEMNELEKALKAALQELEIREQDQFRTMDPETYIASAKDAIRICSRIGQFNKGLTLLKKTQQFAVPKLIEKKFKYAEELKELQLELEEMIEKVKRIEIDISPQIIEARNSKNYGKLFLYLGDRGKERKKLELWEQARIDFEEQKNVGEYELKRSPEQMSRVYANLGAVYKGQLKLEDARMYLAKSLKPFNGTTEEMIDIFQDLYEVYKLQNFSRGLKAVREILDLTISEAQSANLDPVYGLEIQERSVLNHIDVCEYFKKKDDQRAYEAMLKRIQRELTKLKGADDSIANSDADENYVDLVPVSPPKPKRRQSPEREAMVKKRNKAVFATLGEPELPTTKPTIKKKNPVVVESSQDSESFLEDFPKSVSKVPKKRYLLISCRNAIFSSVTDDMDDADLNLALNPSRTSFQHEMNEHDMMFGQEDQIEGTDNIIELSDPAASREYADYVEETIPATPFFGTDPGHDHSDPVQHIFDDDFVPVASPVRDDVEDVDFAAENDDIIQSTPTKQIAFKEQASREQSVTPVQNEIVDKASLEPKVAKVEATTNSEEATPVLDFLMVSLNNKDKENTPLDSHAQVLFPKTPAMHSKSNNQPPMMIDQTPLTEKAPRLRIHYETPKKSRKHFTIPYNDGPMGTPKTVRWLLDETNIRYKERHKTSSSSIKQLWFDGEELCPRDALKLILDPDSNLDAK